MSRMRVAHTSRFRRGQTTQRQCRKTGETCSRARTATLGFLFTYFILTSSAAFAAGACNVDTTQPDFQAGNPFNVVLPPNGDVRLASDLTIDQKNENLSGSGGTFNHFWWYAQTFTAGVSGPLSAVEVRLFCSGCFSSMPDVRVSIRAVGGDGKPTTTDLAYTTMPGFTSGAGIWYRANFASPMTMSAGTQYAIVVGSTAPASGQYAYLYSSATSTYPGGHRYTSTTAGNAWIQQNYDTGFRVFTSGGYVAAGHLDSSLKDSNPGGAMPIWQTLSWSENTPGGTDIKFQAAGSNSPGGPFNFVGPDGTPGTTYNTSGGDLSQFNGLRYLKYKSLLSTSNSSNTPILQEVQVCYDSVANEADLSITKDDGATTSLPGDPVVYTITASNAGPSPEPSATVTDFFDFDLLNCTWTCSGAGGGTCPSSGSGDIDQLVNLPVGASVTFIASCDIDPNATGTLSNTATVGGPVPDPVPGNNSATDNNTLAPSADLVINKTDGFTTSAPGDLISYVIDVDNFGPSNVGSATVTDTFNADLQNCSWTCSGTGGGSCPASGFGNINANVSLPVFGGVTFFADCEISPDASGTLSNTASVSSAVNDPFPGDNSDTDINTLSASADIWIVKDDFASTSVPGGTITYDISAYNFGPSNVASATVIDNFNADLENCTWSCFGTGGASCATSGAGNINENVSLPVDGSVVFTVDCDISVNASGTLSNTATISSAIPDPFPGDNSSTDVNALNGEADLSISKTDGSTTATPGGTVTYTITAGNTGPSAAPNATVIDTFPSELSNCNWTCFGGGGASCPTSGSGNINENVSLPVFGSVIFSATCDIDGGATGTLSNTATVSSALADPQPGNNSATDNSAIDENADLYITKTDGASTQTPGETVSYTIVAGNAGPSEATSATVQDFFPSQLQNCSWTCAGSAGGSCPASGSGDINHGVDLPAGASVTFNATCDIDPVALGTLSNTATVSSTTPDPNDGDNEAIDNSNLVPAADLGITKSDGASSSTPGDPISYTIIASNFGPSHVGDATITDTFSGDLENCAWTCAGNGGGSCAASGSGNINTGAVLPVDGSVTIIANCDIDDAATGTLSNTASVSSSVTDPAPGNNSATDNNGLTESADLSITKSDGASASTPGGSIVYTIVASNAGPSNVGSATVTDTFGPDFENCAWTCSGNAGGSCPASGSGNINSSVNLPAGGSVTFTASCDIAAGASGTLSNTASVSSALADPVPGNNSATDINNLDAEADLSISKTDGSTTATPGGTVTYTITAGNTGPSDALSATVTDTFPGQLSNCSWTCFGSNGGSCPASGSGNISHSVSLPVFGSVLFTATCDVDAGATGTLSNTATVSSVLSDPQPGNNSATDNSTLNGSADLSITKSDGASASTPGGSIVYTIVAGNAGPSDVANATVTDSFGPDFENCAWTCSGNTGGSCPASGSGNINDSVNLPAGGSVTFTADCDINAAASGTLSNTASVSSALADPVPGNNSATDINNLDAEADLSISKSDGASASTPGGSILYTIVASNAGPSNVGSATVTDSFGPDFENCSWTCSGNAGGSCPASGSGNINDNVNLPAGGSVTFTAGCDIAAGASGTLSNTASVSSATNDPAPGNNSATDINNLDAEADLSISKTDGSTTATPGGTVTYTITAGNTGPSDALNATVTDTFPGELSNCSWTCFGSNGGSCPASGSGNISHSVSLPVFGSVFFTATCDVDAGATGTLSNTASVSSVLLDPQPGNNSATDNSTLNGSADLSITKSDGASASTPGSSIVYTIVASNSGPSNVGSATVTDSFGPDFENCSWTCSGNAGGSCPASGSGNINNNVNLPVGGSVTFTAGCDIATGASGTLSNTASVSSALADPVPGNNSATDNNSLSASADLAITKTDGASGSTPGGSVVYTITASNNGPSNVGSATVTDTFGPDFENCAWTCSGSAGGSCPASGSGNINAGVNLPVGGSVTFTAGCDIDSDASGTLSNTASVSSAISDPTPGNNSATDVNSLTGSADLGITKSDGASQSAPGDPITYTIVASNAGPTNVAGATVTDNFSSKLQGCAWTCAGNGGGSCPTSGSGDIDALVDLPVGASATFTANCSIDAAATGTLSNTASVTSALADPVPGNNSATDINNLDAEADLSISNSNGIGTATPGTPVTYSVIASNAGPSDLFGVNVSDSFPTELENCTWTCFASGGAFCPSAGSGNINEDVALPVGGIVNFTANCDIDSAATGSLSNTATVSSTATDPVPGNNSSTDTDTLVPSANLAITKSDGASSSAPGNPITYTIVASNIGPSDDSAATVTDNFAPELENCAWTCNGAGGGSCPASGSGNINESVSIPDGGNVTFTASCDIDPGATGTLTNTATVTAGVADPVSVNNSATDNNQLERIADLQITKTDGTGSSTPGGSTTYTIVASNAGPSNVGSATVTDNFGPKFENCAWTCSGSGGGSCPASGSGNISAAVGLPAGASVTFIASCDIDDEAVGSLANTASVSSAVSDPVPGNNSATDVNSLSGSADLYVTKTDGSATATPGESVVYTIVAGNTGPSAVSTATVTDNFMSTLENCAWTCAGSAGGSCPASGSGNISESVSLPVGASVTFTASCDINAAASGTLSNTASVSSALNDPSNGNNSATDNSTLTASADLQITKTDGSGISTPGGSVAYTIVASNAGPSNASTATVTDTFGPDFANCAWTCSGSGGGSCPASGVGNINASVSLPAGASTTFTATCNIDTDASGTLSNTTTVSSPVGDPAPGNNSATDNNSLVASADLQITKTDGASSSTPGGSVTYSIVASNVGPSNVASATVSDTFVAELENCSWVCSGSSGGSCPASGSGNINASVSLPAGASVTFMASCDIDSGATGVLTNTAFVSSAVNDPATGNNSATDNNSLGGTADLLISKTDGAAMSTPGKPIMYTITAANNGPSNAAGATVTDAFSEKFENCTWTCSGSNGGSCAASGNGDINENVSLPFGASVTFLATCDITSNASGTLSNTASITSPLTDPISGNNSSTDNNSLLSRADLNITKTDGASTSTPGGSVVYTIVAGNAGPSDGVNVTVTDSFGPKFENCSWTCSGADGGVCAASGTGNISESVTLPANGSTTFIASCDISDSASGTLSNTASVSGSGLDPASGNNSATDVNSLQASADLGITKTDGATSSTPGGSVSYTIVASNAGPSNVASATVTDNFGPDFENCSWTCSGSGGGSCPASGSGNISAGVGLPNGASVSFTASCDIDSGASGVLSNTATVASAVNDPAPGNNSATDNNSLGGSADLSISKTDGSATATPGGSVSYSIVAGNSGPSNADSATVTDNFGPDLENCTWTCSGNNGGSCPASGSGNINASVSLPVGATVFFTANCDIDSDASGTLSNTASVSSVVSDPSPANNSATDNSTLEISADLQITKTDGETSSTPGGEITYTIVASNAGPSDGSNVNVVDTFGTDFENCSWTCLGSNGGVCPASGTDLINENVTLPVGASTTFTATCDIANAASGSLSNTASISGAGTDPNMGNNSATDVNTLDEVADLSITKSDGSTTSTPGGSVTYAIVASNAGPSDVDNATVTDNFGTKFENCTWTCSASAGSSCPASGSGNISAPVSLASGGNASFSATCDIDAGATGVLSNMATVSSAIDDPVPGNNSATDENSLGGSADLSIIKTDGASLAVPGNPITYTITASNAGPSDVSVATVTDTFSDDFENCSWTCSGEDGGICAGSGTGNINQSVVLPASAMVTFLATCDVVSDATGTLSNTATISSALNDPLTSNNSSTDNNSLFARADLRITKTDGSASSTPGAEVTYTIVASNAGPSDGNGVTVTDSFGPDFENCSWTCSGNDGGVCAASGTGNISESVTLPAGASTTFLATCHVIDEATGMLSNTASIAGSGFDPTPANNSATDENSIQETADLSITKTDGQNNAMPGDTLTYTMVASSAGPSTALATVIDNFPAELENCSWTCSGSGGASCPASGSGDIAESVELPKGASVTFLATCDISLSATETISNTVSLDSVINDPNLANNSATDNTALEDSADLSITKTDEADTADPGSELVYTIVASNAGPSDDDNALVTDEFPPELENCEWICDATGGASCPAAGAGTINATVNLPVGGSTTFTAICDVASDASGLVSNTATVTGSVTDPSAGNNTATDHTEILPSTDLVITVSDGLLTGTPGDSLEYTIIASNVGPSEVEGATVTDTFPPELLNCSWTCTGNDGGSCDVSNGFGHIDHDVTLPVGASATFTATCDIDLGATGVISNTAIVLSDLLEIQPANNMDTDLTNLDPDMLFKGGFE